jgi:hypothetical protein
MRPKSIPYAVRELSGVERMLFSGKFAFAESCALSVNYVDRRHKPPIHIHRVQGLNLLSFPCGYLFCGYANSFLEDGRGTTYAPLPSKVDLEEDP